MWKKINHGGEPTKNIDKKYAIFVGRYQPYHFGHIELIKQKLNQGIPALIMVRNIEPDERNPFTTEQTVKMIKKYHAAHGDDVEVMIIPDIESVNYGRGVGYEINEYQPQPIFASISFRLGLFVFDIAMDGATLIPLEERKFKHFTLSKVNSD